MKLLFGVALFYPGYILKKDNLIKIIFNRLTGLTFYGKMIGKKGGP